MRMNDSAGERLQRRWSLLGFALCVALAALTQYSSLGAWLDAKLLDAQIHTLKRFVPTHARDDVIIVGIDEGDVHHFPEPMTLWHRHIGDFLRAASQGHATAVGLDIALPERSFDEIVRSAASSVASTTTGGATPASSASRNRAAHRHHASPSRRPGNSPRGVIRTLPWAALNRKNASFTVAQTTWTPVSSAPVEQKPSR